MDVRASVEASVDPSGDPTFANIGPTFNKSLWKTKQLDMRRFRANIIVGSAPGQEGAVRAWEEETWRDIEFWGDSGDNVQIVDGECDVSMEREKAHQRERLVRRGGMVCVSRCGRCQVCLLLRIWGTTADNIVYSSRMWILIPQRQIKPCHTRSSQSTAVSTRL
jgi:hypothetical protein